MLVKHTTIFLLCALLLVPSLAFAQSGKTVAKSDPSAKKHVTQKYANSTTVKQIQLKLKDKGFYSGAIDGIWGSLTKAAVKKFQTANKLKTDSIVGLKTKAALGL